MCSPGKPYTSCIKSFGKPILPPSMTDEKRQLMRRLRTLACEREANREKILHGRERQSNLTCQQVQSSSQDERSAITPCARKMNKADLKIATPLSHVDKCISWTASPVGTPETVSSATLVPSGSESEEGADTTISATTTGDDSNMVSSASEELPTANETPRTARTVFLERDKTLPQKTRTAPSPLCRSLSFTVEKPSLALLLWRGRCRDTPTKQNNGSGDFNGSAHHRAISRRLQCNKVAHPVSPLRVDNTEIDRNVKNSRADEADTLADDRLDWDASGLSTVMDGASLRSEPGSTSGSSSTTRSHRNTEADDAEDESSDRGGNETMREGATESQSATRMCSPPSKCLKSLPVFGNRDRRSTSSIESMESSAAESDLQTTEFDSINKEDEEGCKVSGEPACLGSDLSMNVEDGNGSNCDDSYSKYLRSIKADSEVEENLLLAHNNRITALGRGLAQRYSSEMALLLQTEATSTSSSATLSQGDPHTAEDTGAVASSMGDPTPSDLDLHPVPVYLDLLSETRESLHPRWRRCFVQLTAMAKGHLTRRLLNTDRVQTIIQTIKDTLQCALTLHHEPNIRSGAVTEQDLALHQRLITQLTSACHELHDIFFAIPVAERMRLVEQLRLKKRLPESVDRVRKSISSATEKVLQRRLSRSRSHQGVGQSFPAATLVNQRTQPLMTEICRVAGGAPGATRKVCRFPVPRV